MDADLEQRWAELAAPLGAPPAAVAGARDELDGRYAEPHRHYHTLAHIRHVLDTLDELDAAGEPCEDPAAVRWAAWYHDAVYELAAGNNEAASAELAMDTLTRLGVPEARCNHVGELILATADHQAHSADARLLVDADLAILGAQPEDYQRYVGQIRAEYAALSPQQWRTGRGAFLDGMLARPSLYHTRTLLARAEAAARRNLHDERAALAGR